MKTASTRPSPLLPLRPLEPRFPLSRDSPAHYPSHEEWDELVPIEALEDGDAVGDMLAGLFEGLVVSVEGRKRARVWRR